MQRSLPPSRAWARALAAVPAVLALLVVVGGCGGRADPAGDLAAYGGVPTEAPTARSSPADAPSSPGAPAGATVPQLEAPSTPAAPAPSGPARPAQPSTPLPAPSPAAPAPKARVRATPPVPSSPPPATPDLSELTRLLDQLSDALANDADARQEEGSPR